MFFSSTSSRLAFSWLHKFLRGVLSEVAFTQLCQSGVKVLQYLDNWLVCAPSECADVAQAVGHVDISLCNNTPPTRPPSAIYV